MQSTITLKKFRVYFERLKENFGNEFVYLLLSVYLFIKGFLLSLLALNQLPYFKNVLKVDEKSYQIFIIIAWTPWSMKALFASISDLYPLWGYHKKSYMLISSTLTTIAVFFLAFIKLNHDTATFAPFMIFIAMLGICFIDLLCEGKYAELMRVKMHTKGDAVSWAWGCNTIGSLIAAIIVGIFTDYYNPRYIYIIGLPFAAQVIIPIAYGYMPETFYPVNQRKFLVEKFKKQYTLFFLSITMACFALGMVFINLYADKNIVLIYSLSVSLIIIILSFMWMPKTIAFCNLYLFLLEACYIHIPGALDYWYTADNSCVPNGPHFNLTYFITYTSILGSFSSIIGIYIFQVKMMNWKLRSCFFVSILIRFVASLFDIFIVTRVNIKLGIPDKFAFLFGDSLIMNTASMLITMPSVLLTSRICTKGYESTTYALLAGFQNFGQSVSKAIGISLMGYLNIDADIRPCNFKNLPYLIMIAHSLSPLLVIPLTKILLPNVSAEDNLTLDVGETVEADNYEIIKKISKDEVNNLNISSSDSEEEDINSDKSSGEEKVTKKKKDDSDEILI